MTQDEIIRMAVECQLLNASNREGLYAQALERFADLVAAHEREKHNSPSWETVDDAIAAEREACAKVCDEQFEKYGCVADKCAAAIRARGDK